jgi:hypothetical protein
VPGPVISSPESAIAVRSPASSDLSRASRSSGPGHMCGRPSRVTGEEDYGENHMA